MKQKPYIYNVCNDFVVSVTVVSNQPFICLTSVLLIVLSLLFIKCFKALIVS